MKRRNSIVVTMLMGASVIALSACEEPTVDAAVFESLQQCLNDPGARTETEGKTHAQQVEE